MEDMKKSYRWLVLTVVALVLLLAGASALLAQGGYGGGPGRGLGFGNGMGMGRGAGMHRGFHGFMLQDPEIRSLMGRIRIISLVNDLGLSREQVRSLLQICREAQGAVSADLENVRARVKSALQEQLDRVLAGGDFDETVFENLRDSTRQQCSPGEMRADLDEFISRAKAVFSEQQLERLQQPGPVGEEMRRRFHESPWGRGFRNWMESMDEEQRSRLQERFENRMEMRRERMEDGRIIMFLLNPETDDALELWLDRNR